MPLPKFAARRHRGELLHRERGADPHDAFGADTPLGILADPHLGFTDAPGRVAKDASSEQGVERGLHLTLADETVERSMGVEHVWHPIAGRKVSQYDVLEAAIHVEMDDVEPQ